MVLTVAMEEFLRFVLGRLLEHPEEVVITASEREAVILLKVEMRKSEVGKLIGRNGQVIQSIRHLLNAAAERHGRRALLEIVE